MDELNTFIKKDIFEDKEMMDRTLNNFNKEDLKEDSDRKYVGKMAEGGAGLIEANYAELVPETSAEEAWKHRNDLWTDIFKHTEHRIAAN
jgi:hypothetical protein